jgi:hypothetical protein
MTRAACVADAVHPALAARSTRSALSVIISLGPDRPQSTTSRRYGTGLRLPPGAAWLPAAQVRLITRPVASARNSRCSRNSSAAPPAASLAGVSPVACQYSCSPHAGASDSWKDERRPVAAWSQFQPPSGHWPAMTDSAIRRTRGSAARPSRQQAARAFPSTEACIRGSPPATVTLRPGRVSQART